MKKLLLIGIYVSILYFNPIGGILEPPIAPEDEILFDEHCVPEDHLDPTIFDEECDQHLTDFVHLC